MDERLPLSSEQEPRKELWETTSVSSQFDGTYWWVVVPDEIWELRESMEYLNGIPLVYPNRVYK
jgi:hypothetical protein